MSKRIVPINFRHATIKCIQNTKKFLAMYISDGDEPSNYYKEVKYALMELSKIVDEFEDKDFPQTDYKYACNLVDYIKQNLFNYDEKTKRHMNRFLSGVLCPLLSEENKRNKRTNKFIFPNKK